MCGKKIKSNPDSWKKERERLIIYDDEREGRSEEAGAKAEHSCDHHHDA